VVQEAEYQKEDEALADEELLYLNRVAQDLFH